MKAWLSTDGTIENYHLNPSISKFCFNATLAKNTVARYPHRRILLFSVRKTRLFILFYFLMQLFKTTKTSHHYSLTRHSSNTSQLDWPHILRSVDSIRTSKINFTSKVFIRIVLPETYFSQTFFSLKLLISKSLPKMSV